MPAAAPRSLPPWLKVSLPAGPEVARIKAASRSRGLATVCEEARCPNLAECWGSGTATFMILGDACTRGCRFCSVATAARPPAPDLGEPERLALTLREMGVSYAVLTTVCRDDLPDQGAGHIAACLRAARAACPDLKLELLLQDFRGEEEPLARALDGRPDVAAHNVECVERLSPLVRDARAGYRRSLRVLESCRKILPGAPTKTSLMLGLGESPAEIRAALRDILSAGVEILTLGQYLRPSSSPRHLPVARFAPPEEFDAWAEEARAMGFAFVAAGPLVRSSYRAAELFLTGRLEGRAS